MTAQEAHDIFKKANPKLTITEMLNYSDKYYVITALENPNENDFNDPYFAVDKKTGKITRYFPMDDFENFIDARQHRQVRM